MLLNKYLNLIMMNLKSGNVGLPLQAMNLYLQASELSPVNLACIDSSFQVR